jgi:hypothetical protein
MIAKDLAVASTSLLTINNGIMQVGIDRNKGGAITWVSSQRHPGNFVNLHDPGRLIQQSYYAGRGLDRKAEGQSPAWSPWTWNPIQGGGVESWARVTEFTRTDDGTLYAATVPKLWDMPSEEAAATMRQWLGFEPGLPNVVVVTCQFESERTAPDRWGPAVPHSQEIPACYFIRKLSRVMSYVGEGRWRDEVQPPGPPWGRCDPPLKTVALVGEEGYGVAVFSPAANETWNFGPHLTGQSDDPGAGPCMHVAPLERVALGPRSFYRYRYWLMVGTRDELARTADLLWQKYQNERSQLTSH